MEIEDNKASHDEDNFVDNITTQLVIRIIMNGKEVGSIIGKGGEVVKRFREESGAKINISDGSCPERIVTVTGTKNAIYKAFSLMTKKFQDWCEQHNPDSTINGRSQISMKIIVPASQCGSLIGKGGSKIKEIRESSGCAIQVASEMLPNSTERAVTLTGSAESVTQGVYHICCVMLESPPKGTTIPYRAKQQVSGPVIVANGQAYTIQGNYAVPAQDIKNPLAGLAALGLAASGLTSTANGLSPTALAALAGSQLRTSTNNRNQNQSQNSQSSSPHHAELNVPNELIGCVIGKGGTKIAEIRQITGAMIRISSCEDRESGNTDRKITITGTPDAVQLAECLITMSLDMQKANLNDDPQNPSLSPTSSGVGDASTSGSSTALSSGSTTNPNPAALLTNTLASTLPLAQLLAKPETLAALSSLSALGGLTDILGSLAQIRPPSTPTTGVHRVRNYGNQRSRSPNTGSGNGGGSGNSHHGGGGSGGSKRTERNKFNP